jgi:hypothetical protein
MSKTYLPAQLPSNDHAYTNMVYLNPNDFRAFIAAAGSKILLLHINNFIVRAEQDASIKEGELGLSKFQREAMQIGKSDQLSLKIARITDKNPLGQVDLQVDLLYLDEEYKDVDLTTGAAKIHEKVVIEALRDKYNGLFVNEGD